MSFHHVFTLLILIVGLQPVFAYDLSNHDFSYKYDVDAQLRLSHLVVGRSGGLDVFIKVQSKSLDKWQSTLIIQENYESIAHDTLDGYRVDTLWNNSGELVIKFQLESPDWPLLLYCLSNKGNKQLWIEDVRVTSPVGFTQCMALDSKGLPVFEKYVNNWQVKSPNSKIYVRRYKEDFDPADPPMGKIYPIAPTLDPDTSYFSDNSPGQLLDYHFFLIQSDSSANNGITLLQTPNYFPKFRKIEELIEPLTYITTRQEMRLLESAGNKLAFENFWTSIFTSQSEASRAIRKYYRSIEEANAFFTDYKTGWKTDRGLIYTIMGIPNHVSRSAGNEIWYYNENIKFEFMRISTLFASPMYVLKRSRDYEKYWYVEISKIRKGL